MNDYTGKGNALFIILNVTHICNLSCKYCYYESEMQDKPGKMSLGLIRRVFERAAESSFQEVQFCFHGGEPMTLGREGFIEVLELQKTVMEGKPFKNSIQTNGTLYAEDLIYLNKHYQIHIGLSVDGPAIIHDFNRINKSGEGSYKDVAYTLRRLAEEGITLGILAVCSSKTGEHIGEFYEFYKQIHGIGTMDLLVPHFMDKTLNMPVGRLAQIYKALFDRWFYDIEGTYSIRFLESIVSSILVRRHGLCSFDHNCFANRHILSIDTEGNLAPCDNCTYINLGNLNEISFDDAVFGNMERMRYARRESQRLEKCVFCEWFDVCRGGCPLNESPQSVNFYCEDLKSIFYHVRSCLLNQGISVGETDIDKLGNIPNPKLRDAVYNIFLK